MSTRIAEYKELSIRTGQILSNAPYSIMRDHALQESHDKNSSCFSIIHKSERSSINSSVTTLTQRFSLDLNKQHASTNLGVLGYTGYSVQQRVMFNAMLAKQSISNTQNNLIRNEISLY